MQVQINIPLNQKILLLERNVQRYGQINTKLPHLLTT